MKINFTKKQYKALLEMMYMGNWVVNSHRLFDNGKISNDEKRIEKYDDLQSHIFSFAKDFHLEDWVDQDDEDETEFYPSRKLEEGRAEKLINEYEEEVFWENLIDKMAKRDFIRKYGIEEIRKMETMERIEKDHPFLEKYQDEMYEHGIERLEIVEDEKENKNTNTDTDKDKDENTQDTK